MHRFALAVPLLTLIPAFAADPPKPPINKIFDNQLTMVERELVPLLDAMPEDKFQFTPKVGEFRNVRTFAQQATHIAYVNYAVAAAVLGEKNPSETGANENGPANLKTKDDVVQYVRDSFAYTHRAMNMLTDGNLTDLVKSAFTENKTSRVYMANVALWHSMDHYGQMVVYARMNGIIPPASR